MMPSLRVMDGPTRSGVSSSVESSSKRGGQAFFRQLDAIALHPREPDLAGVAIRRDRLYQYRLARRRRLDRDRLGGEVERDAEDVRVLDVEEAILVGVVRLAAERTADHLLAEKLRAERADAEDVGDGPGVPALGEHGNGDDAPNRSAERTRLADGVHDLA